MVGGESHVSGHNIGVTYGEDLETLGELLIPEADVAVLASCQVTLGRRESLASDATARGKGCDGVILL